MPKDFVIVAHNLKTYELNVPHFNLIQTNMRDIFTRQYLGENLNLDCTSAMPCPSQQEPTFRIRCNLLPSSQTSQLMNSSREVQALLFYSSTGSLGVLLFPCLAFSEDPKDCIQDHLTRSPLQNISGARINFKCQEHELIAQQHRSCGWGTKKSGKSACPKRIWRQYNVNHRSGASCRSTVFQLVVITYSYG